MVTSRDVARAAHVSQATVSRVLSSAGTAAISVETRRRVEEAVARLGYVPHAGAQAMKTRRTHVIGVVVEDLTNPFYPEVLDEVTRTLDAAGYRVVLWNTGGDSHQDALRAIGERAVDGVVFTTATGESAELRTALEQRRPLVLINRVVSGLEGDQVSSDNRVGGAVVADYLVAGGRGRVAFVGGSAAASTSRDRAAGFLERMGELGRPVPDRWQRTGGFSHDRAREVAARMLSDEPRPDAVFCVNDYMAFGVLDAMHTLGLGPHECWVVGYDDVEPAAWPAFDLTTVRQPSREMAAAGARMLIERLAHPDTPPQHLTFPSNLIVRGSTEHRPR